VVTPEIEKVQQFLLRVGQVNDCKLQPLNLRCLHASN
jgi:hypothetical protein